ncbi:diguanylate phosphodiesterase [Clostridium botulinum]|uniref:Diguanylate phosphodiesterase n=1 Tax=Clostridium botulinum TaxID=1491 RepID=A0ABC8CWT8_CLOBO|nr:EAL domain-containing protein [Clostridium botulinum]AVQ39543.1 diguanylate phosphodiesterase [Clostridium botulinum]
MDTFVARQPIFDINENVVAYELLFRTNNEDNKFNNIDGDIATSKVIINSFLLIGIKNLTDGKKAFINFTENLILNDIASLLPKEYITIEILENVTPSKAIICSCKKLKQEGYTIALDDFILMDNLKELIRLADIIKIDFTITKGAERKEIIDKILKINNKIKFLAEKIETREEFTAAASMGYSLFQGYFFSKPTIFNEKDIPIHSTTKYKILKEINKESIDFNYLEELIKTDLSLYYKLLKFINSSFSFKKNITSVKKAIALIGEKQTIRFISFILVYDITSNNKEYVKTTLVRAKFLDLLSKKTNYINKSDELFFMGLFYGIEDFLNKPLEDILHDLPISEDTKSALLGKKNKLNYILNLVLNYEKGEWKKVNAICKHLNLSPNELTTIYINALNWTNKFNL